MGSITILYARANETMERSEALSAEWQAKKRAHDSRVLILTAVDMFTGY